MAGPGVRCGDGIAVDADLVRAAETATAAALQQLFLDAGFPEGAYVNVYATNEQVADVIAGRLSKVPGVVHTDTHIAFRAYSRHDLEQAFAIGS